MIVKLLTRLAIILVIFVLGSCSTSSRQKVPEGRTEPYKVFGKRYYPLISAHGFEQTGTASWYGKKFHGRKTSTGEIYNMYAKTAAHKTLPFGTTVSVKNLENGKETLVRVNDRGPFVKGRVIDLSYKGAEDIGILEKGTAYVKIKALGKEKKVVDGGRVTVRYEQPASYEIGDFTVQVGSFLVWENAARLKDELAQKHDNAHITTYDTGAEIFYRVRVTKSTTLSGAYQYQKQLEAGGFKDAFVVAD